MGKHSKRVRNKVTAAVGRIPIKLHRNVSLVKTADGDIAEELLANKKLAGALAGRLSSNVLLVQPGQETVVVEELRKLGQTPQVVRGNGASSSIAT